jgi:AraC-like DNA-binding protein
LFEHTTKLSRHQTAEHTPRFYREASLLLISQIVVALAGSPATSDDTRIDEVLRRKIAEVIEEGLHQPLHATAVAAQCNMSERTLRRRWGLCTGRPLTDEIRRRRIERAKHLLLLADISVAEVGYQVGIESPAQFSRMFRNLAGMTPTAYRDKYLRGPGKIQSDGPPFRTEFLDGKTKEYRR